MGNAPQPALVFSDWHDVVRTVCFWRNGTCYRIEIIKRLEKQEEAVYAALVWVEEEHAAGRILVKDVTFPWVHRDSADAALDQALRFLAEKLQPRAPQAD